MQVVPSIRRRLSASRVSLAATLWIAFSCAAADWPQYRGPNHNGVSTECINLDWTGAVTNPVWVVHLTNGLTSLTISDGRVFTQVRRSIAGQGREVCLALSATNGAELWATPLDTGNYPNGGVGIGDDGPRCTPSVVDGSVYVLGAYHKLYRLNATNGEVIWSTNLTAGFGGAVIPWQSAASPLMEDGLIFVNANCGTGTLMAFDATNGTLVWRSENEGMTHATPVLATIHDTRQLIFATQSGLVSLNPQTGARLWKSPYPFNYSTSLAASPVVHQDMVFQTAAYAMGAYAVRIVESNGNYVPIQLWADRFLQSHWSTPVSFQGAVFGPFLPDDHTAELRCIDLATGQKNWAVPEFGRGGILLIGTNLLISTERGELVLAEANTNAYVEIARFQAIPNFDPFRNKCWNALSLSDGQVYIRSSAYAARFDLSAPDVPELKLDPPQLTDVDRLTLTIRTAAGTPVDSNRLTSMEVRASTDAALPAALWPKLTNVLVFTNGIVQVTNVDAASPARFFIVTEPKP
jgi:outer membrane protein assembly factor BamB